MLLVVLGQLTARQDTSNGFLFVNLLGAYVPEKILRVSCGCHCCIPLPLLVFMGVGIVTDTPDNQAEKRNSPVPQLPSRSKGNPAPLLKRSEVLRASLTGSRKRRGHNVWQGSRRRSYAGIGQPSSIPSLRMPSEGMFRRG